MAGTHQIWLLDLYQNKCSRFSGNGAEGNSNQSAAETTWAQPSGITPGHVDGRLHYFIADSESSAIRALDASTK
jgi:hypothetical protein